MQAGEKGRVQRASLRTGTYRGLTISTRHAPRPLLYYQTLKVAVNVSFFFYLELYPLRAALNIRPRYGGQNSTV